MPNLEARVARFVRWQYEADRQFDARKIAQEFEAELCEHASKSSDWAWLGHAVEDGLTGWFNDWLEANELEPMCARELSCELWAALGGEEASAYHGRDNIAELCRECSAFANAWVEAFEEQEIQHAIVAPLLASRISTVNA